jgi:TolB-like protein
MITCRPRHRRLLGVGRATATALAALGSATYERSLTDAFAVQDELTGLIVAGVRETLRA